MSAGVGSQYYSAFNPLDIGGCALWLDATDQSTLTLSGTNVTQWNDKSGNGRNMTASGTITNTGSINGLTAANWASNAYFYGSASNTGTTVTVFAVFNMTSSTSSVAARVVSLGVSGTADYNNVSYAAPILRRGGTIVGAYRNGTELSRNTNATDQAVLMCSLFNGSTNTIYTNGTASSSVASTGNFNYTQHRIGSSTEIDSGSYFRGTIGEVIIYNDALSDTNRQIVEGYLSRKWFRVGFTNILVPIGPFVPTSISSCQLWLDAADTSSLTLSGSNVTAWNDKSGTSRTVTFSGTSTYNSTNKTVSTSSSSFFYANVDSRKTTVPNLNVFIVYKWQGSGLGTNQSLWGSDVGGGWNRGQLFTFPADTTYAYGLTYTGVSPNTVAVSGLNNSNQLLYNATYSYGVTNATGVYVNGIAASSFVTEAAASGQTTTTNTYFGTINGSTYIAPIDFYELIIFNSSLTTTQRRQVEGYLTMKWGIQSSITGVSSTHPYYSIVPVTRQFAPVDVPNCALWLDGADPNSMTISTSATGSATLSQYVTTSAQNVSYNIPLTSLSSFIGGTTFMNGTAINFGNGTPGVFAPSASNGVWYAIDSGYTKAVKVQFALSGTTLTVQGLSAGYGATAGVSPLNSGAVNDVCYNTYSPTTIATSSSTASYGVASFTMNYTVAGSNFVSQWNDKSGNARNFTASGPGATWDSVSPGLTFTSNLYTSSYSAAVTNETMFIVVKYQNSGFMIGSSVAGGREVASSSLTQFGIANAGIAWGATTASNSVTSNTPYLVTTVISNGSNTQLALNGSTSFVTSNITAFSAGNTQLGREGASSFQFQGTIYEVLAYSTVLSTTQRQQVEGYLAKKWGLVGSTSTIVPFAPTQISGCALWLDAADSTTVTGTNPITNWSDKSGTGKTVTFVNTNTYTNGVSVNTSGSSSAFFKVNVDFRKSITPYVNMFIVHTWSGSGLNTQQALWGQDDGGGFNRIQFLSVPIDANASYGLYYGNSSPYTLRAPTLNTGSRLLYSVNLAYLISSSTFISVNGNNTSSVTEAVASPQTTTQSVGFASQNTTGGSIGTLNFHEIIIYTSTTSNITAAQRQQVEGYLANKWGLSSSLPSTHPYALTGLPSTHPYISRNPRITVFNPRQISGCALWLDGADPNSMTLSGSNVTQWNDKSGNGRNTSSLTGTATLLTNSVNAKQGVYFNGTSYFTGPFSYSSNTLSWFVVGTVESDGEAYGRLLSFGTSGQYDYDSAFRLNALSREGSANEIITYRNAFIARNAFVTYGTPFVYSSVIDGTSNYPYLNGRLATGAATSGNFGFSSYGISSSIGLNVQRNKGYIFEVLIYSNALTTPQRQQIEGYLAWKWGLVGSITTIVPFTPTQISGCSLWLDGADSATIDLSGTMVTQWRDKSGNARNTSAVVGTPQISLAGGFGSLPAIYFGSNTAFTGSISYTGTTLTAFVVARVNTAANPLRFFSLGQSGRNDYAFTSDIAVLTTGNATTELGWYRNFGGVGTGSANVTTIYNSPFLYSLTVNGSTGVILLNGSTTSSGTTSGSFGYTAYAIGAGFTPTLGNYLGNGYIAEVILYHDSLTTTQRQQVEAYLTNKWGLSSSSIPSTHPYKLIKP